MEGLLIVPPERNLLSRGTWKQRYVVLGPRKLLGNTSAPRKIDTPPETVLDDDMDDVEDVFGNRAEYEFMQRFSTNPRLSIYRQKTDLEPLVSYPLECVTSCYVGDIAHRKAFSSMSKTTYNPLCPTLVVNLQLDASSWTGKRRGSDSPTASSSQLYEPEDNKVTLFFRSGPSDVPPLTIWCREIQSYIRASHSRRSSTITFGGDKVFRRQSFRSVAYDLKIAEDEWEEERATHPGIDITTRSSEESMMESSRSSDAAPSRPISRLNMREIGHQRVPSSATQSPVDPDSLGPDYMMSVSVSSSPRRETILDRAFSMNYIPSLESNPQIPTPPLTSVAQFEAVANDPSLSRRYNQRELELDPSIMPASFFQYSQ